MIKSILRPACTSILLAVTCCQLAGCSRSDKPATYPVHGSVVYRGKPLSGAAVAFLAPGSPRVATGKTDDAGNFQLTTFEPNDGAVPGTHEVTVKKYVTDPPPLPAVPPGGEADPAVEARYTMDMARWLETAKFAIPEKYTDRTQSGLRFEVKEGENDFKIELVD